MTCGNSDQGLAKFGKLSLKLEDLLKLLFNAAVVFFFLHERDGAEMSSAAKVLLAFGSGRLWL